MPGQLGLALDFDAVDDSVNLGTLDVNGTGLTLAAWFNADAFPGPSNDGRLISKATGVSANDHVFMLSTVKVGSVVRLRGRIRVGGVTTTLIASSGNLATGSWQHAAFTYNGATMRLYLNGVQVGSTPLTGAVDQAPTVAVAVGSQPAGAGARFWDGRIDDVRILQKALSASEVADLASVVNDAPVLLDTVVTLADVAEDAGAPVGAVGTLLSSIADLTGGGGQNNITDPDSGALAGLAITAAHTTNGSWHYSTNGGTNWNALGAVANNNARLLAADANTRVYFQPTAGFSGTVAGALDLPRLGSDYRRQR